MIEITLTVGGRAVEVAPDVLLVLLRASERSRKCRLGVIADRSILVDRGEVHERKRREASRASH